MSTPEHDDGWAECVMCPPELRHRPYRKPAVEWAAPGIGLSAASPEGGGFRVADLAVGEQASVIGYALRCDPLGRLWLQGTAMACPLGDPDRAMVVERVADGFRLLSWPEWDYKVKDAVPEGYDRPCRVVEVPSVEERLGLAEP